MATDLIEERVRASLSAPGVLRTSGVDKMCHTLRSAETAKAFDEWAAGPFTTLIRDAIRDMALRGTTPAPCSVEVAYGITCGLQLAARLLEDPSTVYTTIFSQGSGAPGSISLDTISETFSTPPDEP